MYNQLAKRMIKDSLFKGSLARNLVVSQKRYLGDVDKLKEKEKGDERLYFTKHDGNSFILNRFPYNKMI